MTTILILGDMHGIKPNIHYKEYDHVICVGDFVDTLDLRPLFFEAIKQRKKTGKHVHWYEIEDKARTKDLIMAAVKGGERLMYYLKTLPKPVYYVPGNVEFFGDAQSNWKFLHNDLCPIIRKGFKDVINCEFKIREIGNYIIIGYGQSSGPEDPEVMDGFNDYPKSKRERLREFQKKSLKKLRRLFKKAAKTGKSVIFLTHNCPYNTKLDSIINKDSPRDGMHYGSTIARTIVEEFQPLLCIGGHMHEHFNKDKLGKTVCINAGFGEDANILLKLNKNKITSIEFYGETQG